MNKTEYLETLTFKMKNHKEVKERYADYKKKAFDKLIEDNKPQIQTYLEALPNDIKQQFYGGKYGTFFEDLDLDSRTGIRFLYTNINHVCRYLNEEFIIKISKHPNENQNRCFAVKFYLRYYSRLNKLMMDILLDMVRGR